MHKVRGLYHVNSVQATHEGVYAGFYHQGAFVKIYPAKEMLIANPQLKMCHNAQFTSDGKYILINDTRHCSLQVFDRDCNHVRTVNLRQLSLSVDFAKRTVFGDSHQIWADWLRGLTFSSVEKDVAFWLEPDLCGSCKLFDR